MQRTPKSSSSDCANVQALGEAWFDALLKMIPDNLEGAQSAVREMGEYMKLLDALIAKKNGISSADHDVVLDLAGRLGVTEPSDASDPGEAPHGLRRNQLSKVRAVYIMDALASGESQHMLSDLYAELKRHDFTDEHGKQLTEAALRSHLFRMKDAGHVAVVGTGVYELTEEGFAHRKRERAAQQPLIERFRGSSAA